MERQKLKVCICCWRSVGDALNERGCFALFWLSNRRVVGCEFCGKSFRHGTNWFSNAICFSKTDLLFQNDYGSPSKARCNVSIVPRRGASWLRRCCILLKVVQRCGVIAAAEMIAQAFQAGIAKCAAPGKWRRRGPKPPDGDGTGCLRHGAEGRNAWPRRRRFDSNAVGGQRLRRDKYWRTASGSTGVAAPVWLPRDSSCRS